MNPFYSLLRKGVKYEWTKIQEDSFNTVKKIFENGKVLRLFNPNYETLLETDSSGYGVGAVLMQRRSPNHQWEPIEFASRTLNSAERNYSNIEREALSIIFGVDKYKSYLLGSHFLIRNDQQPLRKLFNTAKGVPLTCSA